MSDNDDVQFSSGERDISAIEFADWPQREIVNATGSREPRFQVVFCQSVVDEIHLHGQTTTEVEVCGVVVGNCYRDQHGPYLLIDRCIRGTAATSRSTNVTFTADTWQHIQQTMDRDYPDRRIVGWYHTHPGFGIFLSDMDVFICENFFNLPWQVAFVYDPRSGEEDNFIWRAGRPEKDPVLIEHDVTPASAKMPLISKQEAMAADVQSPAADDGIEELQSRVRQLERRQRVMLGAIVLLVAFAAFWLSQNSPVAPTAAKPNTSQPATALQVTK